MPKSNTPAKGLVDTWGRKNRRLADRTCPECKKLFRPLREQSKYCSRGCLWKNNGGHNRKPVSWWKGAKGYILGRIWLPDGTKIHVRQHRFIVEGVLGRPLHEWEDVHHKDGRKDNNAPENLEIIAHGEHTKLSNSLREYQRGYKLNLSQDERDARSLRAIASGLAAMGRAAKATA